MAGKILFLRLFRLGRIPSALNSAQILSEKGFPVVALEYGNLFEEEEECVEGFPRLRWESPWAMWVLRPFRPLAIFIGVLIRLCSKINDEGKPQIVIAHGLQEQALAWLLKFFLRVPYAVHVHEAFHRRDLSLGNWGFLLVEGAALRGADFVIFPQADRARLYRARYGLNNPEFIAYNCPRKRKRTAAVELRESLSLPPEARVLLYVGGIGDNNALPEAVEALAHSPETHLLLVGWENKGERERLQSVAIRNGVSGQLHWQGVVDEARKWELLASADASYCIYEPVNIRLRYLATASNKFMESAAAGLPVLCTQNEDFRSLVEDKDIGVCVRSTSAKSIAEGYHQLWQDSLRLARWGKNARKLHETQWHYEKQFEPVLRYYESRFSKKQGDVIPPLLRFSENPLSA